MTKVADSTNAVITLSVITAPGEQAAIGKDEKKQKHKLSSTILCIVMQRTGRALNRQSRNKFREQSTIRSR